MLLFALLVLEMLVILGGRKEVKAFIGVPPIAERRPFFAHSHCHHAHTPRRVDLATNSRVMPEVIYPSTHLHLGPAAPGLL